jgi:hypothetical protein
MKKRIPLTFSDFTFGTKEYGYIPRPAGSEPDDEDMLYQRHVRRVLGLTGARVVEGTLIVPAE